MGLTLTATTSFYVDACCNCGMQFAMPTEFNNVRRNDHKTFYCPSGHPQSYQHESEAEKLRRERDSLKQDAARLEDEKRDAIRQRDEAKMSAARAVKKSKQLTKRAASGTCPCCTRSFSNMAEHMKQQHPEFVTGTGAKVVPIKRSA